VQIMQDDPASALCAAAGSGDLSQVKRLIDNGVDPNKGDYDRRTALHLAAAEGNDKVCLFRLYVGLFRVYLHILFLVYVSLSLSSSRYTICAGVCGLF